MTARAAAGTAGRQDADEDKRGRILRAAMETFVERGFASATTLEIATRARVSKRELYALVGNKEQMLAACISNRGRRMSLPGAFPRATNRDALRAALLAFAKTTLREITDPAVVEVFRLGIAEAKRSPAIARSIDSMGRAPASAALKALLDPARREGLLGPTDFEQMRAVFQGLLWGGLLIWILLGLEKPPTPKEIERRAEAVVSAFLEICGKS
ncbi:MAG TPA: TetR/AcrR family transcriptional regulator [Casimicrobiaceae bacterium]|nr:TetR/AcrR family transcriptional regulator [Casimicrobiaceae bacterium]